MSGEAAMPDPLALAWQEIEHHGLAAYIADLDAHGFTVIPPSIASPDGLAERMLDAVLDVGERRNGERPDLETGATHAFHKGRFAGLVGDGDGDADSPIGDLMQSMLFEDPVFEEALMNPVLLAMATYLCGYGVVLSSMGCFMKGPNRSPFLLHTDTPLPSPLPPQALVCNLTYVLTPFDRENGATAFVPGSHRWCRGPVGAEANTARHPDAVAVEAEPGALVVWHGNTWHGAFNRTKPGLRVSVPVYMSRPFIRTQENLIGAMPDAMLERNPPRFAILTQQAISYGYESQADSIARGERAARYAMAYAKETGVGAGSFAQGLYN